MKYIFLVLALLVPHFCQSKNALILNESQVNNIIDSSCDAALEGSMIGLLVAYGVYDAQDHSDKTLLENIKAFRWHYAAIGGTACVVLAIQAEYLTAVLMNSLENMELK